MFFKVSSMSEFPERVFTEDEVKKAREFMEKGYKHKLSIEGSQLFKSKTKEALGLVKAAGYYGFLTTYIRKIVEIGGLTQLRETEASIWANIYAVEDPVEAASLFVQKAYVMKEFLEGRLYYGGEAELRSIRKRLEFLEALKKRATESAIKERCEVLLRSWNELFVP